MLKKILFTAYCWTALGLVSFAALLLFFPVAAVMIVLLRRPLDESIRLYIRGYGWVLVCLVPFLAPVKVEYRCGELPEKVVFIANHNSAIDAYLFGAIPKNNSFVTTWPFNIPVYKYFMHGAKYVNATKGRDYVIEESRKLLERGCSITIWPEGHRSRDGKMGMFKNGAFVLSCLSGCPVVPVCVIGSHDVLPPGKKLMTPGRVKMIVLEPHYPPQMGDERERVIALKAAVRKSMEETLKQAKQI